MTLRRASLKSEPKKRLYRKSVQRANPLGGPAQGAGAIVSSALEASTVDLAKEFSDLITTQRAYSAATRIITTADQMLQELMQIKQ